MDAREDKDGNDIAVLLGYPVPAMLKIKPGLE